MLHATNLRIPIVEVEGGSLTSLAGFDGHQGVALVVEPRQFASLDDVLARAAERGEPPFVLVLDSLEDPHNVGTLLRSAEAAGVHGVLFPTHRQAPLSPSAVKASAGAIEHLLLCPVDDLPGALSDLHTRGVRVAGSEGDAPMTARQSDLRGPLAIVVGSEGQGLGPAVRRRCDLFMRIPMKGAVGSLNAAVAGSILLFEALAQRDPNATPRVTPELGSSGDERGARGSEAGDRTTGPAPTKRRGAATAKVAAVDAPASSAADEPETAAGVRSSRANALEAPDVADGAEPAPRKRVRKGLSTEPDDSAEPVAVAPEALPLESPSAESPPKKRVRKGGSTGPGEPTSATTTTATTEDEPIAKPKPARKRSVRKDASTEPSDATAETAEGASLPSEPASTESEDDLLPADGATKRQNSDGARRGATSSAGRSRDNHGVKS